MDEKSAEGKRVHVRLESEALAELDTWARSHGITRTEAIKRGIEALLEGTEAHEAHGPVTRQAHEAHAPVTREAHEAHATERALEALTAQLETKDRQIAAKDEQIRELLTNTASLQSLIANSQTLQGITTAKAIEATKDEAEEPPAAEAGSTKGEAAPQRRGMFARIRDAIAGTSEGEA